MSRQLDRMIGSLVATLACATAFAQSPAPAASERNDYSKPEAWLCRPGRQDACTIDLTTTIVAADGTLTREEFKPNPNAPIDCFYVYPTVSLDQTGNSDMQAGPEEQSVIRAQFARFGSQCRLFAPIYRQITLTALRASIAGNSTISIDRALAYNDVLDAWNHYLKHDNNGRGVVLIGHSQGSGVLTQLIRNEIDGKPIQSQLVSALLIGSNVAVPKGKDVGGAFQKIPLCRSSDQTGCVVSYVSFRSNVPPPSNSRFGRVPGEGMTAACVNPAALKGGKADLHSYLSNTPAAATMPAPRPWLNPPKTIDTPFVSTPGLLTGECVERDGFSYLSVHINADPNDPRTDDIAGDVVRNGQVATDWGLHLIDMNIAMGDLVALVGKQAKAYLKKK
ncbi:MAG TPA: DUF3089 domain-containing protein [Steroidobacteraceae bacterium]